MFLENKNLAPRARFELATLRLTAECSTIELPGNGRRFSILIQQRSGTNLSEFGWLASFSKLTHQPI